MAIVKCKECGVEVSSKADACQKCGARLAAKPMGCGTLIGVSVLGLIIISALLSIFNTETPVPATHSAASSGATSDEAPEAKTPEITAEVVQWRYSHDEDGMGKGVNHEAAIDSVNTVEFDFPYSGPQQATLTMRNHPRYGKDVLLSIERGQILCQSYESCTVLVRFDDEAAVRYAALSPADNSTETIFISNYRRFAQKMLKAKRVRISANIYQEGSPVFEFDVSEFSQEQYKGL